MGNINMEYIINFINSKDIRKFLLEQNYQLNAVEAAFIVDRSLKSMDEKIKGWNWIIENMPNTSNKGVNHHIDDFHNFLRIYISFNEEKIRRFKDNKNNEYVYTIKGCFAPHKQGKNKCRSEYGCYFSLYDKAIEYLRRDKEAGEISNNIIIYKERLDDYYHSFNQVVLTPEFEISSIILSGKYNDDLYTKEVAVNLDNGRPYDFIRDNKVYWDEMTDEYLEENIPNVLWKSWKKPYCERIKTKYYDIDCIFDDMFINIPTPFKRGDILLCNNPDAFGGEDNLLVLEWLVNWSEERIKEEGCTFYVGENHDRWLTKFHDYTDMNAYGYTYNDEVGIYNPDNLMNYLELEYYDGELTDGYRCIKVLSEYIKGNISLELYTDSILNIRAQEYAKRLKKGWGLTYVCGE